MNKPGPTKSLTLGGIPVATPDIPNAFAKFFSDKISSHVNKTHVNTCVYNGKNKIIVQNRNFMQRNNVNKCIMSLKPKKCEGFDQVCHLNLKNVKALTKYL